MRTATTGIGIEKIFLEFKPDCVVTDMALGESTGLAVIRSIRHLKEGRTVRIIAMSGHASDHEIQGILHAGANAFLKKPFTATALLKAMEQK